MLEVATELREAYITKLGGIQISGVTIPFYDELQGATVANIGYASAYCLIMDQSANDILVKNSFYQSVTISIDVVTKFPKNKGGKKLSEQISNEILQLIRTGDTTDYPTLTNFQIVTCSKTNDRGIIEENVGNTVFRKILTFSHKIKQINQTT